MTAASWNGSAVTTQDFTWNTMSSALLSNGTFDYLYGTNQNVPIAQIDTGDSVTDSLLTDPSSNVRGIVEDSSGAAHPDVLANYSDYDAYGNPMTKSGGSVETGGLTVDGLSADADSAGSYGFGGGYTDATALDYLVHRYYGPNASGFISVDPALSRTSQAYAYVSDNPLRYTDALGTWWCRPHGVAGKCPKGYFPGAPYNQRRVMPVGGFFTPTKFYGKTKTASAGLYTDPEGYVYRVPAHGGWKQICVANEPCPQTGRCIIRQVGDRLPYHCVDATVIGGYKYPSFHLGPYEDTFVTECTIGGVAAWGDFEKIGLVSAGAAYVAVQFIPFVDMFADFFTAVALAATFANGCLAGPG
jgi:RHS repeat-associated protein